jgi:heme exporter protein CcmD
VWWNTLHQGPTISKLDNPSITFDMLWPLLAMMTGFALFAMAVLTQRVQGEVLEREQQSGSRSAEMKEFLAMGGYAQWVWSAFGLTIIVLIANVIAAAQRYRRAVENLKGRMDELQRRGSL